METKLWHDSEVPKLPLLAITAMQSPDRSGMVSPPIHTSASVPFLWEEEPGKPRFSFMSPSISNRKELTQKKCLELPPRLLLMEAKIPKVPPPINLLEGQPYVGRGRHQPCSFHKACCGSFRFEEKQLGAMVLRKRGVIEKEWFGWLGKRGLGSKREVGSGYGSVFPSSLERESESESESGSVAESSSSRMKVPGIHKKGSFSCLAQAKTEFWGSIHEGLKQINVPWKSKKHEKERWTALMEGNTLPYRRTWSEMRAFPKVKGGWNFGNEVFFVKKNNKI